MERTPPAPSTDNGSSVDEVTLADEQWPVAEQYRVEPDPATNAETVVAPTAETVATTVASPVRRRFPPGVGPGLLAALLALALLVPAIAWYASRSNEDGQAAGLSTLPPPAKTEKKKTTTAAPAATKVQVPDVSGLELADGRAQLLEAGFTVRVQKQASESAAGEILRQSLEGGSRAERKTPVVLTVSTGPEQVSVPLVVGLSVDDASRDLRELDLRPRVRRVSSDEPVGTVVSQLPAGGESVEPNSVVQLVVAKAAPRPATVRVPDLFGLTSERARARLTSLGLRATVTQVTSSEPEGTVVGQSPGAGADVRKGSKITLRVSTRPPSVAVPDVTGVDEQTARFELTDAGFEVRVVYQSTDDPAEDGLVLDQTPLAGTSAKKGSIVTLTVGRFA